VAWDPHACLSTPAAIYSALSGDNAPVSWIAGAITFVGRQDNLAMREAAFFAFAANLLMVVAAITSIVLTVPSGRLPEEARNERKRNEERQ
jgi:hypothetical protein